MKKPALSATVLGIYAIIASFVFSATAAETWLLYPNIFRDIPESLEMTEEFMSVIAVGDVMRPLGAAMLVTGLVAAAVAVTTRIARRRLAYSLAALITGQFLLSMVYLWPRASILFDERGQHTLGEIEAAATQFQVGQYFRLAAAGLAAMFAVTAALECYRAHVLFGRDVAASQRPSVTGEFR